MLKCGQTKIPIQFRSCRYCKHENGRLTNRNDEEGTQYCTSDHVLLNHWVTAQDGKSCCGWEPARDGYERLVRDRLAGKAKPLNFEPNLGTLDSFPDRSDSQAGKFNHQHFSWLSFMEHRPCPDDT